ncbi:hypothetical protein JM93_01728 [Roseibium hamelinense]|uniref:Uncharacterized protein n=1 Tax=Roseibium hamelinense TaxID=150831 RepID=A0A562T7G4_9HYPH|nr:hypothetical protein [Roseibium hamelinense]TWI89525.1 hypothetical protein JM93_01728 [Roseibium hamelinense]
MNYQANTYAHQLANRFTTFTRPDPRTQHHLDAASEKRLRHSRLWHRSPYWL